MGSPWTVGQSPHFYPTDQCRHLYVREGAVGGTVEAQGCAAYLEFEDVVVLSRPFRQGAADEFYNMLL